MDGKFGKIKRKICAGNVVRVLTMVAVSRCNVWHAAIIIFTALQAAFVQGYEGSSGTQPSASAGWRRSKEVSACITSNPVTALTLTVNVVVSVGMMLLVRQAVAETTGVRILPVAVGDIQNITVLQLRRGRVSEWAAAPRAVLVRF